jgi:uncharacterized protein (DUF1330 family)
MLNVLLWAAGMAAGAVTPAVGAAEVKCDQPVYLMVWVEKFDRKKSVPYAEGLRSSGIVARNGGTYRTAGAPIQLLEGSWPKDRAFVLEEYPCHEAAQKMWFSDEYQKKLKPLRAGSGRYTVGIFKKQNASK